MYFNDEIPKYKKKSKKAVAKSKHKHIYKDCLILDKSSGRYHKSVYCTICGKIGDTSIIETVSLSNRMYRVLSQEELLDMYKDLEVKEVENICKDSIVGLV